MHASISFIPLSRRTAVLMLLLFVATLTYSQITPSQDAYTNTGYPTTNYGAAVTLGVVNSAASIQTTYIQFDLSSIPAGYKSSNLSKATLKLYVNTVTTAGSFNIDFVNGAWTEKKVTSSLAPALGTTIVASVPLTSANVKNYLLLDITSAVGAWLDGTQANDGIALVANSPLSATFDSKENTAQSHPPELDIVFSGGGTITGVTTASGSGLIGGGTSGTLNLSLLTSCASGQVLQWSGSAWACASAGTGTITGVIAGTDLTGGGTSGKVTLNLNLSKVPQLGTANTFTGNQTVNGNLSATGWVTGAGFNIGTNLFAFGSYANGNAFLGFAGNATTTGAENTASGYQALASNTTGPYNTASGYQALANNTTADSNTADGDQALFYNTTGSSNTAVGEQALYSNTTGYNNTANGLGALFHNTTGNSNTASGWSALRSNTTGNSNTASGLAALYSNTTASNNTASGYNALYSNTTGSYNTATGVAALNSNTTGIQNTASGYSALYGNTTGSQNTASGEGALQNNTTGTGNTASGESALHANTTGSQNTASGEYALSANSTGSQNTANGWAALATNTTGIFNTASGYKALWLNTTGYSNTASGNNALGANTTGEYNSADGAGALQNNTTGTGNTASGYYALYANITGTDLTCIGYGCTAADGLTNATAIGANAVVNESNALVLGATGVNVGIGTATPQYALDVVGNVHISGSLSKGSGSFQIDHPLDPANKYLYHSFVESPDMMNVYNGNIVTDDSGLATVSLPDWFEALNRDFRYQLTVIGQFAQAIVASEVSHNQFTIRTDKPNVKISWQVTGIRQDAYANAHRIPVEEDKKPEERGRYLHPELFGASGQQAIGAHSPQPANAAQTQPPTTGTK